MARIKKVTKEMLFGKVDTPQREIPQLISDSASCLDRKRRIAHPELVEGPCAPPFGFEQLPKILFMKGNNKSEPFCSLLPSGEGALVDFRSRQQSRADEGASVPITLHAACME